MNKTIQTNFARLAVLLLPVRLRRGLMKAFLNVIVSPFASIKTALSQYAELKEIELRITGQTCRLRKMLNDQFDPTLRRIRVVDSALVDVAPFYAVPRADAENIQMIYPRPQTDYDPVVYVQLRSNAEAVPTDFYVVLPPALENELSDDSSNPKAKRLAALVNTYKLASKRWHTIVQ